MSHNHQMLWSPHSKHTKFKTYHFIPIQFSFWYGNIITFDRQSIIANRTNLQFPCCLVSYAVLRLFLKIIWRCTCKPSMMKLKSSLVNRIVVTQVTLIWLFILSVTSKNYKECMHNRKYCKWIFESLLWLISLFVVTLSLVEFVKKCDSSSCLQKIHS